MPKIKIDDKEYELDALTQEAKAQLASIQYVDNELQRIDLKSAALQTARISYSRALKELLEGGETPEEKDISVEGLGDNIEFN